MENRACALILVGLALAASACASGRAAATAPASDGSHAWQPLPGAPSLTCAVASGDVTRAFNQFLDYRRRFYDCKLPSPADPHARAGLDFLGPTAVSAGPVPLKPHRARLEIEVFTRRPAVLRVEFGDGSHWQRTVTNRTRTVNVVYRYTRARSRYLFVTLRDKAGYLGIGGEGPLDGPPPEPRTRYCRYEDVGKGGTLSATASLTCARAQKLFSASGFRKLRGYRCRWRGLPPEWSDVGVWTCTSGSRAFVFTTNQ